MGKQKEQKTELESKVSDFIESLQFHDEKNEIVFVIVKDKDDKGMMKFTGYNHNLACCFVDFITQQPELAKIMITALYAAGYIEEETAKEMAKRKI